MRKCNFKLRKGKLKLVEKTRFKHYNPYVRRMIL